jgi:transketolase-like protein
MKIKVFADADSVARQAAALIATEIRAVVAERTNEELDQLSINTIRTLSIDAVQQAKSGHPGTPMALASMELS